MKPVFIIAIAVVCSVVAVLGVLVGLEQIATMQAQQAYDKRQKIIAEENKSEYNKSQLLEHFNKMYQHGAYYCGLIPFVDGINCFNQHLRWYTADVTFFELEEYEWKKQGTDMRNSFDYGLDRSQMFDIGSERWKKEVNQTIDNVNNEQSLVEDIVSINLSIFKKLT